MTLLKCCVFGTFWNTTLQLRLLLFIKKDGDIDIMIFESYKFEECPKKLQVIKKRGRFTQTATLPNKCYERKLPISSAKFKDLSDLCKNGIISEKSNNF